MLKEKRQEAKLSQRRLSELSGVPKRTIQDWERKGVDHATVGNLKKVTGVLGLQDRRPALADRPHVRACSASTLTSEHPGNRRAIVRP